MYVPAVFTSNGEFVSLGTASGEFPNAFGWAPDDDLLAYTVGEAPYRITDVYVHDPTTSRDRFLSTTDDEGPGIPAIGGLAWSPDGRWIAFSRPQGVRLVDVEGKEPARELDLDGDVVDWAPEPTKQNPAESEEGSESDAEEVCPIGVRYALADPDDPAKARLVVEGLPAVVSARQGVVTNVHADEESAWARVTVDSSDMTLAYSFYSAAARSRLPSEGQAVSPGTVIGGAYQLLDLEAAPTAAGQPPSIQELLDEWGCREGLPKVDVLRARLLDGSLWEVRLAEPIEVIGADTHGSYGDLQVDGDVVAGAARWGRPPDYSRPFEPGFDPPVLLEEFTLTDGRRAEHWNEAPSHENDTYAYSLWIEGPASTCSSPAPSPSTTQS
jgi:hypothetical protein